jgi:Leucine-rich repeat (LRR) protein
LEYVPDDFSATLSQLTHLNLSRNRLRVLPDEFGTTLVRLERLDLFKNRLESLPVSIARMAALKWVDVKDNPLEGELTKVRYTWPTVGVAIAFLSSTNVCD